MCRLILLYWLAPVFAICNRDVFSFGALTFAGLFAIEWVCRLFTDIQNSEIRKIAVGVDDGNITKIDRLTRERDAAKLRSQLADPDRVAHVKAAHDMYRRQKNEEIRVLRKQIKKLQKAEKK